MELVKKFTAFSLSCWGTPLVHTLSQMQPVHNFPPYFPKFHSDIIFPSTPRSSEWPFPFSLPDQNFVCISYLSHTSYFSYKIYKFLAETYVTLHR